MTGPSSMTALWGRRCELLVLASENAVDVGGVAMKDVDGLAEDLVDGDGQMLREREQRCAGRPVEVTEDQIAIAEHGVAGQGIEGVAKAEAGIGEVQRRNRIQHGGRSRAPVPGGRPTKDTMRHGRILLPGTVSVSNEVG